MVSQAQSPTEAATNRPREAGVTAGFRPLALPALAAAARATRGKPDCATAARRPIRHEHEIAD